MRQGVLERHPHTLTHGGDEDDAEGKRCSIEAKGIPGPGIVVVVVGGGGGGGVDGNMMTDEY